MYSVENPMVLGEYYEEPRDYEAEEELECQKADAMYDRLYR